MSLNWCWRGVDGLRLIPKADVRIGVDKQAIIVAADSADPFILLALMGLSAGWQAIWQSAIFGWVVYACITSKINSSTSDSIILLRAVFCPSVNLL